MTYTATISYLYDLQKFGMKFGLDNIRRLLSAAGNPQDSFRAVHVAGTNGKGSTSSMIESIIRTGGVTTGLFTSPHLVNFTERIRVKGREIDEEDVVALAGEIRGIAEKMEDFSPTFFEVVTAMAFLYFRRMGVDWAIIETGLGGRLDATNIVAPDVTVITPVGFDHCEFLGRTLQEIAEEKAGIIKEAVPVVSADQSPEVNKVIELRASEKGAALYRYQSEFFAELVSDDFDGICFNYNGDREHRDLRTPLAGVHQMINASMAVKAVEVISGKYPLLNFDVRKGLQEVRWPGRLEMIGDSPPILIDGAHNPQAAQVLSAYLGKISGVKFRRIIMLLGVMADKDIDGILRPLLPLASAIIFTAPAYGRAASPEMLAARAASLGYPSRTVRRVSDAVNTAKELCRPGDLVVATGSFYTIGEVKEVLGGKGVLSRLRE